MYKFLTRLAVPLVLGLAIQPARGQDSARNAFQDQDEVIFLEDGRLQSGSFGGRIRKSSFQQLPNSGLPEIPQLTPPPPAPAVEGQMPTSESAAGESSEAVPDGVQQQADYSTSNSDGHLRAISVEDYETALKALNTPFDGLPQRMPKVGFDYVPFASFVIDSAKSRNQLRIRIDSLTGINRPDRSEFLWKEIGAGGPPLPESRLNMQEFSIYSETAFDQGGGFLQFPLRMLNPEANANTASIGNLVIGTKAVLTEGEGFFWLPTRRPDDRFFVSMYFATEMSLNPLFTSRGLTHGHTTLSPGLLAMYELAEETVFQAEMKLHIPMGGTTGFADNVLEYGAGVSHVLYSSIVDSPDCEHRALIGTLESKFLTFLSGKETVGLSGGGDLVTRIVDDFTALSLHGGLRYAVNNRVDIGVSSGVNITRTRYYQTLTRFEIRWHW